jgi:chemotaxis protein MotB
MTQKLIAACFLLGSIAFSSCGSSKQLTAANSQIEQLKVANSQLQTSNEDLMAKQKRQREQLDQLVAANNLALGDFERYKTACEISNKKLQEYQANEAAKIDALDEMAQKIEAALIDFKDKGVDVYQKDREIYVSMQDKLLYKSGSATLGKEGKKALGAVASAISNYPNLKVVVLGHTDDQKFNNANKDNLSLSTERANGVVRVLRDDYKVDPTRITSAGKGKYDPVADNKTAEGRAKNRRTEIILNPDLLKLWQSVQQ